MCSAKCFNYFAGKREDNHHNITGHSKGNRNPFSKSSLRLKNSSGDWWRLSLKINIHMLGLNRSVDIISVRPKALTKARYLHYRFCIKWYIFVIIFNMLNVGISSIFLLSLCISP